MTDGFTRRELPALIGGGLLAGATNSLAAGVLNPGVVATADLDADTVNANTARHALASAIAAATGDETTVEGMRRLFLPSDVVGIKLNCLAGPRMSPRVELVEALVELLADAGVARNRIIVFERSSRELQRAGYSIRRSGGRYLCYGTDNDYESRPSDSGAIGSCYARLVSTECTALVSFGVVKDHDLAGVS